MENPTIVVITDRNDLDDQLFGTFARCRDLLRQDPVQAADRADLREKLRVAGGGVVFTTIQKFMPAEQGDRNAVLSDRRNIVVIADEAHRSQYDFIDGFARHMRDALPQASFARTNTRAVFGDYISIYDIARAVEDGATVPIYYEGRPAKLELSEAERPRVPWSWEGEARAALDKWRFWRIMGRHRREPTHDRPRYAGHCGGASNAGHTRGQGATPGSRAATLRRETDERQRSRANARRLVADDHPQLAREGLLPGSRSNRRSPASLPPRRRPRRPRPDQTDRGPQRKRTSRVPGLR